MTNLPLVSVLITAFNRSNFLGEAIESITASDYKNIEIIIVDDCSTDETLAIAKEFEKKDERIKVYKNENNLGDYHNRNRAASLAKGKYLKYVDSDDTITPYCLSTMVNVMEAYPDVAFAASTRYNFEKGFINILEPKKAYEQHFFLRNVLDYGPSGVIIRKLIFDRYNGFSGKRNISDFELWLKIAAKYKIAEIEPGLVYWREHDGQEIRVASTIYLEYRFNVIKEALINNDCPLNGKQKKFILKREKKIIIVTITNHFLKTRDINLFFNLLKINGIGWADILLTPYLMVATSPRLFPNINKKYLYLT